MKSEQAERILKIIADSLEGGKVFIIEQAPDVVQQLVLWGRVRSIFAVMIPLLIALELFLIARIYKRKWGRLDKKERWIGLNSDFPHPYGIVWIMSLILAAAFLLTTAGILYNNLQVWLAPKVFVLEYLAGIAR